jgi:hypothetical protein
MSVEREWTGRVPEKLVQAVDLLLPALKDCFGETLRCVLLKGSALKGDFIPGYSDLDLHSFLSPEVMVGRAAPRADLAMRFQASIGRLEPHDYDCNSFQLYFLNYERYPQGWAKPVPGSYLVLHGDLPPGFTDVSAEEYRRHAREVLGRLPVTIAQLIERGIDKPDRSLPPILRLAGIELKQATYAAASLRAQAPLEVWTLPRTHVLARLSESEMPFLPELQATFAALEEWQGLISDPNRMRATLLSALGLLGELSKLHDTAL